MNSIMKLSWLWMFPEEASILMLGDLSQARPGAQIFMVRNLILSTHREPIPFSGKHKPILHEIEI